MADLSHDKGGDLQLTATGGLALATSADLVKQRLVRRLFTNPGDDMYNLDYGAGVPAFIGSPASAEKIKATILKQMRLERTVDQNQLPRVDVHKTPTGDVTVNVQCNEALSGLPVIINKKEAK